MFFFDRFRNWLTHGKTKSSIPSSIVDGRESSLIWVMPNSQSLDSSDNDAPSECFWQERKIGQGAFADIMVAHSNERKMRVAIKNPRANDMKTSLSTEMLRNEFAINTRIYTNASASSSLASSMTSSVEVSSTTTTSTTGSAMGANSIVQFLGVTRSDEGPGLVFEYLAGGDCWAWLTQHGSPIEERALLWFSQLVAGLDFLHNTCRIVHRDIKLENLLLDESSNILKIADFGLSATLDGSEEQTYDRIVGTPEYMAPEIIRVYFQHKTHDVLVYDARAADVWAAGICLYAFLFDMLPYDVASDSMDAKVKRKVLFSLIASPLTEIDYTPHGKRRRSITSVRLLRATIGEKRNPQRRITARELCQVLSTADKESVPTDHSTQSTRDEVCCERWNQYYRRLYPSLTIR